MIKEHPHKNIDITLITTSQMELGVRSLSSILKQEGYNVIIGFFDSLDRKYTKKELENELREVELKILKFGQNFHAIGFLAKIPS